MRKEKTRWKKRMKMFIVIGGLGYLIQGFYHYTITNSATSIVKAVESKKTPSQVVLTSSETLVINRSVSGTSVSGTSASGTSINVLKDEIVKEPQEVFDSIIPGFQEFKKSKAKKYKSLEEYRNEMNIHMDISKPSGLSKATFVKLMKDLEYDYTGLFSRSAKDIWETGQKYQVDEVALASIAAQESGWGASEKAIATNNYTSQMKSIKVKKIIKDEEGKEKEVTVYKQKLRPYKSEKECFEETAKNLRDNYLKESGKYYHGKTLKMVNLEYCAPVKKGKHTVYTWYKGVYGCMKMIVGKE